MKNKPTYVVATRKELNIIARHKKGESDFGLELLFVRDEVLVFFNLLSE